MFSGKLTHQSKNQSSVARIAMGKETELLESIDKAIMSMVSEYPGRNESERTGSFEKAINLGVEFFNRERRQQIYFENWLKRNISPSGVIAMAWI